MMTLKILIIDDSPDIILILTKFLRKIGHYAIAARSGQEGIKLLDTEKPDLILLDVVMPDMDGFETAVQIKSKMQKKWVPLIFLTAMTEDKAIEKGIEVGGDDYLIKPISFVMLKAKLNAFIRILKMYREIEEKNNELESYYRATEEEYQVAGHLMNQLARVDTLSDPLLSYWIEPAKRLSGDLLAAARTPHGVIHVLLGDGTGNGLSASLNVLPIVDPFYSLTARGSSIGAIAAALNSNLKRWLPVGRFVSAVLVAFNPSQNLLEVWIGGMPSLLIIDHDGKVCREVANRHLPLGILSPTQFDTYTEIVSVKEKDQIIFYSDGLIEAENEHSEQFGSERLIKILGESAAANRLEHLKKKVASYFSGWPAHDDISIAIINCQREKTKLHKENQQLEIDETSFTDDGWKIEFKLSEKELRSIDVVPMLLDILKQFPECDAHNGEIFVILSELFNNALDHGVLGLDSSIKAGQEGMELYIENRNRKLDELADANIHITLGLKKRNDESVLMIELIDSGNGFDFDNYLKSTKEIKMTSFNRGIMLIQGLCESLKYFDKGNKVRAIYRLTNTSAIDIS